MLLLIVVGVLRHTDHSTVGLQARYENAPPTAYPARPVRRCPSNSRRPVLPWLCRVQKASSSRVQKVGKRSVRERGEGGRRGGGGSRKRRAAGVELVEWKWSLTSAGHWAGGGAKPGNRARPSNALGQTSARHPPARRHRPPPPSAKALSPRTPTTDSNPCIETNVCENKALSYMKRRITDRFTYRSLMRCTRPICTGEASCAVASPMSIVQAVAGAAAENSTGECYAAGISKFERARRISRRDFPAHSD